MIFATILGLINLFLLILFLSGLGYLFFLLIKALRKY